MAHEFTEFNYRAWQDRLQFSNPQAAHALDISESFYATIKHDGKSRKVYAWAAYGVECAQEKAKSPSQDQR